MRTAYALLWIGWVAYFLAVEFSAIISGHPQFTLSDFIWRLEEINRSWTVLRYFIAVTCIFLFFHLGFGWFR